MLFKRRRSGPPDWALYFSEAEWREFERVVRAEITPRGISGSIHDGQLTYGKARYGLGNLAQMCHGEPLALWPDIVARHFAITSDIPEELEGIPKARLIDDGYLARLPDDRVTRRVAEDLQLVLSWDQPDRVATPHRDEVFARGEPDDLFAEAIENARAEEELELERHEIPVGDDVVELFALTGASHFTATHALWADEFDPPGSEHGTLVAVPNRHTVLAHPIRAMSMVGSLGVMLDLARRMEQEGPGSISPHLYWLREGRLERLDARITDAGIEFAPSAEFGAMMARLA
ncbi:hypothetical protein DVA67_017175 [Solirubrobacter sp. CPCC 204708]|uniref:DUF4238 domain-containing protein n=1 Tax=Solirubrobacter deserti TaxID=2282478 RepID=A0ABT4RDQ4_9ACTN|nr:hypothetical protein [Solirubrobacter deserti]MBE2317717.1 hypothetical protein [Solirubrobacter deserti]MDA0136506.1 hypothetical protein [Solirubrobacter deserti]